MTGTGSWWTATGEKCALVTEPTFLLLAFALIPRKLLGPLLRGGLVLRHPLTVLALVIAFPYYKIPFLAPLQPFGVVLLFLAAVFQFAGFYGSQRPWVAWTSLVVVGGLSTLQLLVGHAIPVFEATGRAHFWLLDIFNKAFFQLMYPLMVTLGVEEATGFVLEFFLDSLVFISEHLLGLYFIGNCVAFALVYEIIRARLPDLRKPPAFLGSQMPLVLALVPLGLIAASRYRPDNPWLRAFSDMAATIYVLRGMAILFVLSAGKASLRTAFWASVFVLVLNPQLFWLVGLVTVLEDLLGLSKSFSGQIHMVGQQIASLVNQIQRRLFWFTVPTLAAFSLGAILVLHGYDEPRPDPPPESELVASAYKNMLRIPDGEGSFGIDRYEFPNQLGTAPRTGILATEAEDACRSVGKRLCNRHEWYTACSSGGANVYLLPGEEAAPTRHAVRKICNFHMSRGGFKGLIGSGELDTCRNSLGVFDMAGNAFEWVRIPGELALWGLAGSYYGYGDDLTLNCGFVMVVHDSQLGAVDQNAIGFRCCGDTES